MHLAERFGTIAKHHAGYAAPTALSSAAWKIQTP